MHNTIKDMSSLKPCEDVFLSTLVFRIIEQTFAVTGNSCRCPSTVFSNSQITTVLKMDIHLVMCLVRGGQLDCNNSKRLM